MRYSLIGLLALGSLAWASPGTGSLVEVEASATADYWLSLPGYGIGPYRFAPPRAVDGDRSTPWIGRSGSTFTLDLPADYRVRYLDITWFQGYGSEQFTLEFLHEGQVTHSLTLNDRAFRSWTSAIFFSASGPDTSFPYGQAATIFLRTQPYPLASQIRVTGLTSLYPAITEIRVFGEDVSTPPTALAYDNTISVTPPAPGVIRGVRVADVNGDGLADLVSRRQSGLTNWVDVSYQDPLTGLGAPVPHRLSGDETTSGAFAVGDVNGDSRVDIVVEGDLGTHTFLQSAAGTFGVQGASGDRIPNSTVVLGGLQSQRQVEIADLIDPPGCPPGNEVVRLSPFTLDGTAEGEIHVTRPIATLSVPCEQEFRLFLAASLQGVLVPQQAIGDLNGDGLSDLVITPRTARPHFMGFQYYLQTPNDPAFGNQAGQLVEQPSVYGFSSVIGRIRDVAVGDVTGDGIVDVVIVSRAIQPLDPNRHRNILGVFPGQPNALFDDGQGFGSTEFVAYDVDPDPRNVRLADVNGDGCLDVIVKHDDRMSMKIFLQHRRGHLTSAQDIDPQTAEPGGDLAFDVGDVNNDGKPDLAISQGTQGRIVVLLASF